MYRLYLYYAIVFVPKDSYHSNQNTTVQVQALLKWETVRFNITFSIKYGRKLNSVKYLSFYHMKVKPTHVALLFSYTDKNALLISLVYIDNGCLFLLRHPFAFNKSPISTEAYLLSMYKL